MEYLANLYVLETHLVDEVIRDAVIEEFFRISESFGLYPGLIEINIIYEGTTCESDPARRLMQDMYMNWANCNWVRSDHHPIFMRDLAQAFLYKGESSESFTSYRHVKLSPRSYSSNCFDVNIPLRGLKTRYA